MIFSCSAWFSKNIFKIPDLSLPPCIYKFLPSSLLSGVCSLILFPLFATGVVDTSCKFAAGIVDTGGKFATGVIETGGAP